MFRSSKGMSLTTVVMTVLVIAIILASLVYSSYNNLKIRKINELYTDIRTLGDEVAIYYLENRTLPVGEKFAVLTEGEEVSSDLQFLTNDGTFDSQDSLFNPNDYDSEEGQAVYYILEIELFDNISLGNTGKYIINEQSHTIYYYDGITISDESYYALPLNYKNINI